MILLMMVELLIEVMMMLLLMRVSSGPGRVGDNSDVASSCGGD